MWGGWGCRGIPWVLVRDPKQFCLKLGVGLGEAGEGQKLRWGVRGRQTMEYKNALLTLEIGVVALFVDGPEDGEGGGIRENFFSMCMKYTHKCPGS